MILATVGAFGMAVSVGMLVWLALTLFAERMAGAKEYYDRNHKAIVFYLEDVDPLSLDLDLVTYLSWKSNPTFTGAVWLQEVFRKGNLFHGQDWN